MAKKPRIVLTNRSAWPTPAIKVLADWIVPRAGIKWDYQILVRSCNSHSWGGRGSKHGQRIWLDRHYKRTASPGPTADDLRQRLKVIRGRLAKAIKHLRSEGYYPDWYTTDMEINIRHNIRTIPEEIKIREKTAPSRLKKLWPINNKDRRFQWSHSQHFRTRMEVLVMLLAHEAYHATHGHPDAHQSNGRTNRDLMEYRCNIFADETIAALRDEWLRLRKKIYTAMRKDRERQKQAKAQRAAKRGPDHKLKLAQGNLGCWEKKLKYAQNKVKTYKKKVKYYSGRIAAIS